MRRVTAVDAAPAPHPAEPTSIVAVPALLVPNGFRLLVMREFTSASAPSAFAMIEQRLLRPPTRAVRHGLAFALAFTPEAMTTLGHHLGRPSLPGPDDRRVRNPLWPRLAWHREVGRWPDETPTIEWSADILLPDDGAAADFDRWFRAELAGAPAP